MSYTQALTGAAGFVVGALAVPVAITLGETAGEKLAVTTGLHREKFRLAKSSGEVLGATILTHLVSLENSPFSNGLKTAVKIVTAILSTWTGMDAGNAVAKAMKGDYYVIREVNALFDAAITITAIFLAIVSAQFVNPLVVPFVGAAAGGLLNFTATMILT